MKFVSTRGAAPAVSFSEALTTSLAPDGGLYVPERFPRLLPSDFDGLTTLPEVAARFLAPFLEGDPLQASLPGICQRAFDFPMPLRALRDSTALLELFHGPTAAFKDFGARFLAECLAALPATGTSPQARTVLVATSGDTGGAVAAAFHRKPGIEVIILFPKGKVSKRQEKQLTAWGDNVRAFSVHGSFDDCQRIVKEAFGRRGALGGRALLSANSISIGRLLPQAAYYAAASLEYLRSFGADPGVIIPSGNLGNSMGAFWAKACGLPVRQVILATNANRPVPDYFASGVWAPQPTVATLANAMDVGNPSNFERLRHLYGADLAHLRTDAAAVSVTDEQIRATIAAGPGAWGEVFCPHTATAVYAREHIAAGPHWIVVATAHPAKFEDIVEPLIGREVPVPPALGAILARPSRATEIDASLAALETALPARP